MSDPISVLLIIGAAVVGPIDGYSRGRQLMREPDQCLAEERAKHPGPPDLSFLACSDPRPAETIDQLCERAMREVGIDTANRVFMSYGTVGEKMLDGSIRFVQAVGAWEPVRTAQDGWQVRCVPTPGGYRR